jgi:hypothetical protein
MSEIREEFNEKLLDHNKIPVPSPQPGDLVILGRDPHGNPSSQPPFKSGVNRGYRRVEKGGVWIHTSGYVYESRSEVRSMCWEWVRSLQGLGLRIGSHDHEGVKNFYVFKPV